jgi:hypothetical protein
MKKISRKRALAEGFGLLALLVLVIYLFSAAYDSVIAGAAPRAAAATPAPRAPSHPLAHVSPNPFPATDTMTDTVLSVLEAYEQRGLIGGAEPVAVPFQGGLVFLPQIQRSAASAPPDDPTPTPRPRPDPDPADVAVVIWPAPSIRVARGGTLAYEIRVKNYGKGDAESIQVRLPYDKNQLAVTGSKFDDPGDWVSELKDDQVTVTFGQLKAAKSRAATLYFQVGGTLLENTVLSARAFYNWSAESSEGAGSSNWAPVLVGGGNDSAPWVSTTVDPVSGLAGTTHHFFSDRFIPGEGIITWLNTPDGVEALDIRGQADLMGRVWIDFKSNYRRSGTYSLVLYGARSNLTGVATFYVQ